MRADRARAPAADTSHPVAAPHPAASAMHLARCDVDAPSVTHDGRQTAHAEAFDALLARCADTAAAAAVGGVLRDSGAGLAAGLLPGWTLTLAAVTHFVLTTTVTARTAVCPIDANVGAELIAEPQLRG